MPKLDGTQIPDRLERRLEELQRGEEVAARDLRALLTDEQVAAMDAAWAAQQDLRKKKRARTKEEEAALGRKTKREIHIETLAAALHEARDAELAAWEMRKHNLEVRQARIFMDEVSKQCEAGENLETAIKLANNALVRAGFKNIGGTPNSRRELTQRDIEVRAMEESVLAIDTLFAPDHRTTIVTGKQIGRAHV